VRDGHVTGVQTCALPIFGARVSAVARGDGVVPLADGARAELEARLVEVGPEGLAVAIGNLEVAHEVALVVAVEGRVEAGDGARRSEGRRVRKEGSVGHAL